MIGTLILRPHGMRPVLALGFVAALAMPTGAQVSRDGANKGVPVRPYGNSNPALRSFISEGFDSLAVRDALEIIALRAEFNLTFDSRLPGIDLRISIPAHNRNAAAALLEIGRLAHLQMNVLSDGQILVLPADTLPRVGGQSAVDSTMRVSRAQELPAMHAEATRTERIDFDLKPNVGTLSVTGRDMSSASHFFAQSDLLRGVQLLPGVEALNDYNSGLNVRGGSADQNLILLDGYPIYNPFHLGGLFGTFIDPMVGRVDLHSGGFPAQFDGRLSSVLDVKSAEEPRTGIHGSGEVSLISSTLSLGSSIDGGSGNWMVAARRTYADALAAALGGTVPYHFQDAQAHFTHSLPDDARFDITGYTGLDQIAVDNNTDHYRVGWGNQLIGATYSQVFLRGLPLGSFEIGDSARVEQRLSATHFGLDAVVPTGTLSVHSEDDELRAEGSMTVYSASHARSLGYTVSSQHLEYVASQVIPLFPVSSFLQRNLSAGVYYDDIWRPTHSLLVDAGARLDGVKETHWSALLPRLSVKYFVNDNVALTGAFGEYAQWVRSLTPDDVPIRLLDLWSGSDSLAPVSRATHYVLGLERWVTPQRMFRVEGFYKVLHSLVQQDPLNDPRKPVSSFLLSEGRAYGIDALIRQFESGPFSGWAAYTYAVTTQTDPDGYRYFPLQDRRHDLNLVGTWRSHDYALNLRFNVASGTPYTSIENDFERREYDPVLQSYTAPVNILVAGMKDGARLPLSHRLDLSMNRTWHSGTVSISPYLSIANVYNAKNVFGYSYDYTRAPPTRVSLPQFPVLPTLGATVAW